MKHTLLLTLCLLTFGLQAQKPADPFTKIDVFGPFEVELVKAESYAIDVDYRGVDKDDVILDIHRGELKLKLRNKHYMDEWRSNDYPRSRYIRVKVYYTELNDLRAQAGAEVFSDGTLKSKNLALEATMGAEMRLPIVAKNLYTRLNMGAVVELHGQTENHEVKANMGAVLKASRLESKITYVNASMGAEVNVNAMEEIEVNSGFGASVNYVGSPNVRNTSKSFGGEVRGN
ncbi:MAG: DUF2807 domain-containing protein [Cyclobacteriaceae bacterium]|nr:DUF2807 domain-containing protein [Cyclobacteriaceae bacterium]